MKRMRYAALVSKAFFDMMLYEVLLSLYGIGCILQRLKRQAISRKPSTAELERNICDAVLLATCFHWKPVLCLQRSVCTVRLLRKYGVDARLAIGYRPAPFFSHAWVEVKGRVVYGSAAYQKRLQTLLIA
jgi:hypothetical protein